VGMVLGTYLSWGATAWVPTHAVFDWFTAYNGLVAVCANVLVSAILSIPVRSTAPDETSPADYRGGKTALA
jgi:solute:Na+ symporter, SSS family